MPYMFDSMKGSLRVFLGLHRGNHLAKKLKFFPFRLSEKRACNVVDIARGLHFSAPSSNPSWCAPKLTQLTIHLWWVKRVPVSLGTSCACDGVGVAHTPAVSYGGNLKLR